MSHDEIAALLTQSAANLKIDLKEDVGKVSYYAAERMDHLATIANEPGYDEAVKAARDSIMIKAGIAGANEGTAADAEFRGIVHGMLWAGAKAAVGLL